jgi:hypothetical protein
MPHKNFKFTGKRKNPSTCCDIRIDSDRFDNEPDRCIITIWVDEIMKVFIYGLFETINNGD